MSVRQTGIDVLDRLLGGGIPSGSIVALVAPPASNAELLLYQLTAPRSSMYLSTIRSEDAVRDGLEATRAPVGQPTIQSLNDSFVLDQANQSIGLVNFDETLIIDPLDPLESEESNRFVAFLNKLQNHMNNTGGFAVLHCLDDDNLPSNRRLTLHAADVVFNLEMEVRGSQLVNRLTIPKNRGGQAITEEIKLELADRVAIDTSRDIA